ncbi:MAG: hypothetical protein H6R10_791 [Rhodocyclaceae bacterium]|nr:hypothetical protein [Rhodocyclaceae bacterium]
MNRSFSLATAHGPLPGRLAVSPGARALIVLALAQGEPLDEAVAADLSAFGYAVLSLNLLTVQESVFPDAAYNAPLLTQRLVDALDRTRGDGDTENLPVGLFAADHAAPAAIRTATRRDAQVRALVCHGGLIDHAGRQHLQLLAAPLLMLVDAGDKASANAYRRAAAYFSVPHEMAILAPGENPGAHIARWFGQHLQAI